MQLSLSSNISRLRKEHAMTQEQLAEALGVTFASVSKWERGVATPELKLITSMADLFGVSLDALVGYAVLDSSASALEQRIIQLQAAKEYDEAICEAEKTLLRYPNDFNIVYCSAKLYNCAGTELNHKKHLYRSIELMNRSILLLSQNTDPNLGESSIQTEIAETYIILGEKEKGISLLKKHNICGVHNAMIAIALTGNQITYTNTPAIDPEAAVPFMLEAFGSLIKNALRTMMAYTNYYEQKKEYASALDAMLWLIHLLEDTKIDPNTPCYLDKALAPCYCTCANLSLHLGETDAAKTYMRCAYQTAKRFDSAPTNNLSNIKFCMENVDNDNSYDDLGETATASINKQISQQDLYEQLQSIWKDIEDEEINGGSK